MSINLVLQLDFEGEDKEICTAIYDNIEMLATGPIPQVGHRVVIESSLGAIIPTIWEVTWSPQRSICDIGLKMTRLATSTELKIVENSGYWKRRRKEELLSPLKEPSPTGQSGDPLSGRRFVQDLVQKTAERLGHKTVRFDDGTVGLIGVSRKTCNLVSAIAYDFASVLEKSDWKAKS